MADEPKKASSDGAPPSLRLFYSGVSTLLLLLIVVMVNYVGARRYQRWDWTSRGMFTLSERTEEVLAHLDRPVELFIFLSDGEREFDDVRDLVERYQAETTHISVRAVDPSRERGEYELLASRFDLVQGAPNSDVALVVVSGEQQWKITRDDLLELDYDSFEGEAGPQLNVKSERALTGAILQVTQGRTTKVCVATGHGEWALAAGGDRGLATIRDNLHRDNIEMEAFDLTHADGVPEGCDAVWVISPQRRVSTEVADRLVAYLRTGGNALVTLDPNLEREQIQPTGFEEAFAEFGVEIDATLVLELDPALLLGRTPIERFAVGTYGRHPVTELMRVRGGNVVLDISRSVRASEGTSAVTLLTGSELSYGERDLSQLAADVEPEAGPEDVPGPVSLAVAVTVPPAGADAADPDAAEGAVGGRLVVMGDGDWMDTRFLAEPVLMNGAILSTLNGWLTEREELISIPPRREDATSFIMTDADLEHMFLRVVVLIPLAAFLLGFAAWWSRRQ